MTQENNQLLQLKQKLQELLKVQKIHDGIMPVRRQIFYEELRDFINDNPELQQLLKDSTR
ncbi:MAG: hypothetical protein KGH65_05605 [Candidatus Micrarchaeota archaeon]|nr:hypothetical protein [Candidatus Micrarchaeota archaeon]